MKYFSALFAVLLCLGAASTAAAGEVVVVAAQNYRFEPAEITVKPGTLVRWENRDKRQYHSVYFEQLGDKPGDYFFPGETRERVFDSPGDFPYICEPHVKTHGMKGVVHVVE